MDLNGLGERIVNYARELVDSLRQKGIPEEKLSSKVTFEELVEMLSERGGYSGKEVTEELISRYSKEASNRESRFGIKFPLTHLLREELGIYYGNAEEAMARLPRVRFSKFDLLRNVKIPTEIGELEAITLGIFYGDGNLITNDGNSYMVTLFGTEEDFRFYGNFVKPALKQMFGIDAKLKPVGNGDFVYNVPGIEIKSTALFTWLNNHMGLSISRDKQLIPHIKDDAIAWNILKGVLATRGMIYIGDEKSLMRITDKNAGYIKSIADLAGRFGLKSNQRVYDDLAILDFPKTQLRDMLRKGVLINPYHKEKTLSIAAEVIEDPTYLKVLSRENFLLAIHLYNSNVPVKEIESYLEMPKDMLKHYVKRARKLGIVLANRSRSKPAINLKDASASYQPPSEEIPRIVTFMHNSLVADEDISRHLQLTSIKEELKRARRLGLTVIDVENVPPYMRQTPAEVYSLYTRISK